MAVVRCIEILPDRGASREQTNVTFSRAFSVNCNSEAEAFAFVQAEFGVERGVVYEDHLGNIPDNGCTCQSIAVRAISNWLFEVYAYYGYPGATLRLRPPDAALSSQVLVQSSIESETVDVDMDGKPYANTAGELFGGSFSRPIAKSRVTLEWYEPAGSAVDVWNRYESFQNKTNSAVFMGRPIGCWKSGALEVEKTSAKQDPSPAAITYRVRLSLEYKAPKPLKSTNGTIQSTVAGWVKAIANYGYSRLVGGVLKKIMAVADGERDVPLSSPVMLNATGTAQSAQNVYVLFREFDSVDFNVLPVVT